MVTHRSSLEQQCAHSANFSLFFHEDLEVLIDNCDGQQDTGSGADCSNEISHDGEGTDAETAEGSCCWDVSAQERK